MNIKPVSPHIVPDIAEVIKKTIIQTSMFFSWSLLLNFQVTKNRADVNIVKMMNQVFKTVSGVMPLNNQKAITAPKYVAV